VKEDLKNSPWAPNDIADRNMLVRRIAAGADVDQPGIEGCFPLAFAVRQGDAEACRLLLEAGADPNAGRERWLSPLLEIVNVRLAARRGLRPDLPVEEVRAVCATLVAHGTNPNGHHDPAHPQQRHQLPLYVAASSNDREVVHTLVEAGADINKGVYWSYLKPGALSNPPVTALGMISDVIDQRGNVVPGDEEMMLTLMRLGASDRCFTDRYGTVTPFQHCVMVGRDKLVEYYARERGEDLAQRTRDGKTMLQIAKQPRTRAILKALKTELAIAKSVDNQDPGFQPVSEGKKRGGMVPL
jgi:ankyrin repeat protein